MAVQTNWVEYYQAPIGLARFTRWLSTRKILRLCRAHLGSGAALDVCELGGANSCFVRALCKALPIRTYHVVDSCAYGLELLAQKQTGCAVPIRWQQADIRDPQPGPVHRFDLVFSVGLVEHFSPAGTRAAIAAHFARVLPGGLVLITFPTPTLPYRWIRRFAEMLGVWKFPDERPLAFAEVRQCCQGFGEILHESIHYAILLTQGYILLRAGAEAGAELARSERLSP